MRPAEFVNSIVVPTVIEFRNEPRSQRRAYLACVATFHVKDHLRSAGETGIENAMRRECGDHFHIVRAVCNGTKHAETDSSHVVPFKVGEDYDRPPAIWDEIQWDVSHWDDPDGGRELATTGGPRDLFVSVRAVLFAYRALYPEQLASCDFSGV
jgi:hypothetical protein